MTDVLGGEPITIPCVDGTVLRGHLWRPTGPAKGTVIVNPATGVLARYYHPYARFLMEAGLTVATYDYSGIGLSRPPRLRDTQISWRDWGERDFGAMLGYVHERGASGPVVVVGHSIGGFLIGFAAGAPTIARILTIGAQYAFWRDYEAAERRRLLLRWHFLMPVLTATWGYFPGKRLGWLEDLPAGVANEWSFRRARMEASYPSRDRAAILARFAAVRAPILAVAMTDDPYATEPAMRRTLAYFPGCERHLTRLAPGALGQSAVGHFALFHGRFRESFWPMTLAWLRDGILPWPAFTSSEMACRRERMPPRQPIGSVF